MSDCSTLCLLLLQWWRYLQRLTDATYAQNVCACCACSTPQKDLELCEFPCRSTQSKPSWIQVPTATWNLTASLQPTGERLTAGMQWFDAVDSLLNVVAYEETYFERLFFWVPKSRFTNLIYQVLNIHLTNVLISCSVEDLRSDLVWDRLGVS